MKKFIRFAVAVLVAAACSLGVFAQDKVVNAVLETGRTDNRTLQHADHLANVIGGRIIGSAALTEAEAGVNEQFESWGL